MQVIKPFKQTAPDCLEIHEGGGCISLFGVPFFGTGVFVTLIGARIVPLENAAEVPTWSWPVLLLMGMVFVAVGGGLAFGRSWTEIDVSRGSITKQWGLLFPMTRQELSLHDYSAVVLRFDAGDSDTADRYPVVLKATGSRQDLTLYSSVEYAESRERAALVARFVRLPLKDASTDHESVKDPDRLDETFQERLGGGDGRNESVARPRAMRSQIQESSGKARIAIPGPGFNPAAFLGFAIPAALLSCVAPHVVAFFQQTDTPQTVQVIFLGFAVFLFVIIPLLNVIYSVIGATRSRTLVTVNGDGITIEEQGAWRAKTTSVPAHEILDIDFSTTQTTLASARSLARRLGQHEVDGDSSRTNGGSTPSWLNRLSQSGRSKGIAVKSKSGLFSFGAGLSDEEVRYLYSILVRALCGQVAKSQEEKQHAARNNH